MTSQPELLGALRRYWGYDSFRPLQERVLTSLLGGHDVCVVMPTGGGKSLCYQLPAALAAQGTVIVVSPLIALMQDQVAQLGQLGISAALLNSSLTSAEQSTIMRKAERDQYRLLYLSPERLAQPATLTWLQRVPTLLFAIDEAHCISEWGHEFRPDYRQLKRLRAQFPAHPIAAFTASATRRVRHDIIEQLQLHHPHRYIASFHRANLRYLVKQCSDQCAQLTLLARALREHREGSVIVYSPTIARVEETVDWLSEQGVAAVPYHAKMDSAARRRNQERWMSDEVRVLVGTIAFGLGINKASVRAVVHLSLPKSLEQYYQEAGRAGRDGLPADCILLWQRRDAGLLAHFIEQIGDSAEHERAWQRYHDIHNFAESNNCRHRRICLHFGELPKWTTCGACDVCGAAPEWLGEAEAVAPRAKRKSKAAAAEQTISRASAGEPSPQLAKTGLAGGPGSPASTQSSSVAAAAPVDEELRQYLREWRRAAAREQQLPAFIVLHDSTLEELCRRRPTSLAEVRAVPGFGERKTELYGGAIIDALARFRAGARASLHPSEPKPGTH